MAESMCVHLASAPPSAVEQWLDRRLPTSDKGRWSISAPEGYLVLLYWLGDHRAEYDPDDMERLHALLGQPPTCGLMLELRRSRGRAAHDAAEVFAAELLREFDGVLEDTSGDVYWSLADLEAGQATRAADELWPDAWWPHT